MIINCIHCGHTIQLSEAYDEYHGLVRCAVCKNLLTVRMEAGLLRSMEAVTKAAPGAALKAAAASGAAIKATAAPGAALKTRPPANPG